MGNTYVVILALLWRKALAMLLRIVTKGLNGLTYQGEELADLGSTLGTKPLRVDNVGESGNLGLSLLNDADGKNREIVADDAAADTLAAAFTAAASPVARVALRKQKANTARGHDTLLHRETLLVIATSDTDDVTAPFLAEVRALNLLAHLQV